MRIGHGFDTHAFGGTGPITLGGVSISYERGLLAYSDGDVVLHALIDALLGAAALGNIGSFFPETNPFFRNISSRTLLRMAWKYIRSKDYILGNADVTIIAQEPRISPHISQICTLISKDLGCNKDCISVKATTTENLGFTGRREGIACEAVVLLLKESRTINFEI